MNPATQKILHRLAGFSLLALIALCLLWELRLAPLHEGGSWIALKVLPLLLPLRGILKRNHYTMQWASMLIWLYFIEGVVRATSDRLPLSRLLAGAETGLSLVVFFSLIFYLRPHKQAQKKNAAHKVAS